MSGGWSLGTSDMKGNEDSIDNWREFMLSPKGLFPGFASDPSFSKPSGGSAVLDSNDKHEDHNSMLNSETKFEQHENELSSVVGTDNSVAKSGGSIAERRAAKFGFDVSKISTSSFKSNSSMPSPAAKSPYLLRTPGISPSVLLESPMMLPNLQPSPTTGAFALPHLDSENGMVNSSSSNADKDKDSDDTYSFTFNPHGKPIPLSCYSAMQNQHPPQSRAQSSGVEVDCQRLASSHLPINTGFEFPTQLQSEATANSFGFNSPPDSKTSRDLAVKVISMDCQLSKSNVATIEMQQSESNQGEYTGSEYQDGDQKVMDPSGGSVSTSEDGYSWRKYGQKQVKGSEFPRSYYKCTHPSCPVKKKVEHSHDGQVTEIVYKGAHNHPKPQPSRRSTFNSSVSCAEPLKVGEGGSVQGEGGTVWRDSQHGCDDLKLGSEYRPDGLERTCSTSITTGVSDVPPTNHGKSVGVLESAGTPELSSTLASNEEEDDAATQGSMLVANDNEPDMKKQKMEEPLIEATLASRAVREPRVIVQIESEVDILDDGYRWRKYGQKVVKGNPNPRSYYKCTHPGCTVRKHVERASHNLKCVLTTYEGKHNHEVPTARNSSHTNSGGGNSAPSFSNPQGLQNLSQNVHLPKSEPQDLASQANRKMGYNQDFLRPNFLGNFAGGSASVYQMKFPSLPNAMQYGGFHTQAPMIPPPMGFPASSNTDTGNDNSQGRSVGMLQPFFMAQPKDGDDNHKRPRQD
ncbi:hypothetical protein V2J09_019812 [Rumex salicifolius]